MRRLTIVNLETLCWIARLGSFSAAAERLNTTQPAVSRRMKELEDAVGVRLFQRQGRRMELTIEGRALVDRAQPVLGQLEALVLFPGEPASASATIRMGVGEIVAVTWFGRLMARLKEHMPGVNYEVAVGLTVDMRHSLETGLLDVAILAGPVDSGQLAATPIGGIDLHWVAAGRLLPRRDPRLADAVRMLKETPLWCVARPSHMHPMAMEALRRLGIAPRHVNTSDSVHSIVEMVARGAGTALLPDCLVAAPLRSKELARLSKELPAQRLEFVIARRRGQEQPIVEYIVQAAREASGFVAR